MCLLQAQAPSECECGFSPDKGCAQPRSNTYLQGAESQTLLVFLPGIYLLTLITSEGGVVCAPDLSFWLGRLKGALVLGKGGGVDGAWNSLQVVQGEEHCMRGSGDVAPESVYKRRDGAQQTQRPLPELTFCFATKTPVGAFLGGRKKS